MRDGTHLIDLYRDFHKRAIVQYLGSSLTPFRTGAYRIINSHYLFAMFISEIKLPLV